MAGRWGLGLGAQPPWHPLPLQPGPASLSCALSSTLLAAQPPWKVAACHPARPAHSPQPGGRAGPQAPPHQAKSLHRQLCCQPCAGRKVRSRLCFLSVRLGSSEPVPLGQSRGSGAGPPASAPGGFQAGFCIWGLWEASPPYKWTGGRADTGCWLPQAAVSWCQPCSGAGLASHTRRTDPGPGGDSHSGPQPPLLSLPQDPGEIQSLAHSVVRWEVGTQFRKEETMPYAFAPHPPRLGLHLAGPVLNGSSVFKGGHQGPSLPRPRPPPRGPALLPGRRLTAALPPLACY